jgi:hypothetical protein
MKYVISPEELKEIEPTLANASNEELIEIGNHLYDLAQLALECYLDSKGGSKNPTGVAGHFDMDMEKLRMCKTKKTKKE